MGPARIGFCVILSFALHAGYATAAPWNLSTLSAAPQSHPAPDFNEPGVSALFYDGPAYKGQPTRVFAWYGAPEHKEGERLPAMVLVHGGGGTAFAEWVRLWNSRGYAAIAMDTCGCVPKGTYANWTRHEHGGPAGWGDFENVDSPVEDQWTYHAVADVLLAHSLVRSFPEVDSERTGITGISWGGYLTCIAASVDNRFKCAVPVYGCGHLGDNSAWLGDFEKMGPEKAQRWLSLWDPAVYLPEAAMPFLWVNGTNDFAYPMDSWQKSYRLTKRSATLALRVRMPHGHGGAGENPEEIHAFANHILKGGEGLPVVESPTQAAQEVTVHYTAAASIASAELLYTQDSGKWQDRNWQSQPATLEPATQTVKATLPESTSVYYINLIDPQGQVTSSPHATPIK
ncbi:MAG: acetylxylan esterase [FCB group bacterium]|jgi:dienelactone hydrolase|nr:acetylxylan esterase [FCB group bacterium]